MLLVDDKLPSKLIDDKSLGLAISFYFSPLALSIYNSIEHNGGITSKTLGFITNNHHAKIEEALAQLWRADLVYTDYESRLETVFTEKLGIAQCFFNDVNETFDMREWELMRLYRGFDERSPMKRVLYGVLMREDPREEIWRDEVLPVHFDVRRSKKAKQTRAVRYFAKPTNAVGFPIWDNQSKTEVTSWIMRVADPLNRNNVKIVARKPLETWHARSDGNFLSPPMYPSEIKRILRELGLERNEEVLARWLVIMSRRRGSGRTVREYVTGMCSELMDYFPIDKKMPLADIKIYYTLCEGYSKYDFYNTL